VAANVIEGAGILAMLLGKKRQASGETQIVTSAKLHPKAPPP